jgi:hypothetical protein
MPIKLNVLQLKWGSGLILIVGLSTGPSRGCSINLCNSESIIETHKKTETKKGYFSRENLSIYDILLKQASPRKKKSE